MSKTDFSCRHPGLLLAGLTVAILLPAAGNVSALGADPAKRALYACEFTAGHWNRADWLLVKHPAVAHFGDWVQQDGRIANEVPQGIEPAELQRKYSPDTYSGMVYKEKVGGNVTVTSTMAYAFKMAPLILLVPELPENAQRQKEYGEHFEIIIYNEGLNIWRYLMKDGKLTYRRAAFANFPLEKDTKYKLEVKKTGKTLTVSVAGHTVGYYEEALPDSFYVGITGCEGLNYFYDFAVAR